MATITLRLGKGSPLTNSELDANFTNINTELGTKADSSALAAYLTTANAANTYLPLSGGTLLGNVNFRSTYLTLQDSTDTTKQAQFVLSGLTTGTTYSYTLPALSGAALATTGTLTQTFTGTTTFTGGVSFTAATSAYNIGTSASTGVVTIGGTAGTGILTFGRSTVSQTTNIQAGITASGSTKTINIGTSGAAGSTTTITIGSATGTSTTNVLGVLQDDGNVVLNAANYNSYSPTLTGTGASGSWGISVTGNAATATTLQTARNINGVSFNGSADITVADSTKLPLAGGTMTGAISFAVAQTWPTFNQSTTGNAATATTANQLSANGATDANADRGVGLELLSNTTGSINYPIAAGITLEARRASGSSSDSGTFQLFSSNDANETYSIRKVTGYTTSDTWSSWRTLLHSGNYNSYSPTLTGTGASGSWGISITGSSASTTGNAATATTLQTARNINGVSFNGSADITVADSTKLPLAGGTMTGAISFAAGQTWPTFNQSTTGNAATATTLQTGRLINGVSFNGSADITVADSTKLPLAGGTMTGAITFAAGQTWPTFNQSTTGSAATLTTGRTIALTGDVTYTSGSFNGSANVTGAATLANSGVTAGTYTKITVDAKGRATSGTTLATTDIPDLSLDKIPDAWVKKSVRAATTANITLSAAQTIDGIAVVAGDRVLVKNQTAPAENGIYIASATAWARSADADTISELAGACVNVDSGTTNGGLRFDTDLKTTDTIGTTAVNFHRVLDDFDTATANTVNKVVLRDGSGNFSAGTITAALSGNATTATTLQTARNINGVSFNGSADITVADSTKLPLAGGTMTGAITFAAGQTWPTFNQSTTGSAATLTTGRTIAITGDVTYTSGTFNGSANVTGAATLASVGTAGTYTKVTTDAKGRVTSGTTLAAADIPSLDASKITSGTIDAARLPSYVDDVVEATNLASFPVTGETGKIYVALDTNKTYRWSGTAYIYITSGAVDSVAGKTGVVTLVKADVGLGSVDNTADSAKSVASAATLVTGRTIALTGDVTYTSGSFNGSANVTGTATLANSGVTAGTYTKVTVDAKGRVTVGASLASADLPTYTGTITSSQVTTGLGFTPYNATNPSGYITSSASITGTAAGLTDNNAWMLYRGTVAEASIDTATANGFYSRTNTGEQQGLLVMNPGGSLGIFQMYMLWQGGLQFRNKTDSATWNAWKTVLTNLNYNSYSPTLTGGGASGTWGISITGTARGVVTTDPGIGTGGLWVTSASGLNIARNGTAYIGLDAGNVSTYALPIGGGTLTGALTVGTSGNTRGILNTNGDFYSYYAAETSPRIQLGRDVGVSGGAGIAFGGSTYALLGTNDTAGTSFYIKLASAISTVTTSPSFQFTSSGFSIGTNLALHAGNYTNYRHDRIVSSVGSFVALTSGNELEYFNSSGVLDNLYLQYSGDSSSLRGPAGNIILHAGNYSSYALPLSGGSVTGITISAGADLVLQAASGSTDAGDLVWRTGAGAEQHRIWDGGSGLQYRKDAGAGYLFLHAGNYNSYAPTLTGGGASGTWGINVSGVAYGAFVQDTDRTIANRLPTSTGQSVRFDFANATAVGTGGNFAGVMTFSPWLGTTASTGDASYQLVFGSTATNGSGTPRLRIRNGIDSTWNSFYELLTSSNYNSYSPTLTGTGASGTWGISVTGSSASTTGNAATATTLQTARTINGVSFNGSANITVADSTKLPLAGGTVTGGLVVSTGSSTQFEVKSPSGTQSLWVRAGYTANGTATPATSLYNVQFQSSGSSGGTFTFCTGNDVTLSIAGGAVNSSVALQQSGNQVLHAGNYTSYVVPVGGGTFTGSITSNGNVTAYSDERKKTNWRDYAVDFVEQLAKVKNGTYDRTDTTMTQDGVSAQSLQGVLPNSVSQDADGMLSVNYGGAALASAVELAKRVVDQEKRIAHLESLILKLIGD